MKEWLTESSHEVYSHPHLRILEDTIRILPDDIVGERFITIIGKDVALVLPVKEHEGERLIGLVHQYRYSWRKMSWELPSGICEEYEPIKVTAQRELEEETGLRCAPENLHLLVSFRPNAISKAIYCVFEARAFLEGESRLEDTEDLSFAWISQPAVLEMLRKGDIHHGPTYIGLLWYFLFEETCWGKKGK
ncbi:MAG: NUDIX hydrolase [Candidatus Thorarchaeota archaeon]